MTPPDPANDANLSQIGTLWSVVFSAHQGSGTQVSQAQQLLMERYSGAVHRYLLGSLRDRHAADDLFQEFALRFIRGAFRNASPDRGRFRDFVKTSLYHLIVDYHNKKARSPRQIGLEEVGAEPPTEDQDFDAEFRSSWRQEILCRTWEALAQQSQGNVPYYRILRLRSEQPDVPSQQLAELLTGELGRPVSADWVRQNLKRARERFEALLLDELANSLQETTRERLEEELVELNLLSYCQQALASWRQPG
jgi:RNA polymerase sigma-70 factor (ECF subfamily)